MPRIRRADSLLDQIAETALDDDYYVARSAGQDRGTRTVVIATAVAVVIAAAITVAAVQARSARPNASVERATLATQISDQQAGLQTRRTTVEALQSQIATLESVDDGPDGQLAQRIVTGAIGVKGEGVLLNVRDSPSYTKDAAGGGYVTARDMNYIVTGLWFSGAEAIAINGQRIGARSAITPFDENRVILLDFQPLEPPYVVEAIGDADRLEETFTDSVYGQFLDDRAERDAIRWSIDKASMVRLPAAAKERVRAPIAEPVEEEQQ